MDAADRLAEQARHRQHHDLLALPPVSPSSGIVLVTISLSSGDFSMRSIAGPDSTPCTAQASTRSAPASFSACAAF